MTTPTPTPLAVDTTSDYKVALEPPAGTSYFKEYTTTVSLFLGEKLGAINGPIAFPDSRQRYGQTLDITIHFYIYVTLKRASDTNFTSDGGKVYVVAKYSGDIKPTSADVSFNWFKYGFEDTTGLLSPVVALPNEGQEPKQGDVYTYSWDYNQLMSMFKANGHDIEEFTVIDKENFTRTGWKQSPVTSSTYQGYKCTQDDLAKSSDINPKLYGLQVWEATSLGKASLRISGECNLDIGLMKKFDTYELDFSAATMVKSSA